MSYYSVLQLLHALQDERKCRTAGWRARSDFRRSSEWHFWLGCVFRRTSRGWILMTRSSGKSLRWLPNLFLGLPPLWFSAGRFPMKLGDCDCSGWNELGSGRAASLHDFSGTRESHRGFAVSTVALTSLRTLTSHRHRRRSAGVRTPVIRNFHSCPVCFGLEFDCVSPSVPLPFAPGFPRVLHRCHQHTPFDVRSDFYCDAWNWSVPTKPKAILWKSDQKPIKPSTE